MGPCRPDGRKSPARALGVAFGFPIGILGGFTGVGGGEYRTSVLLLLLKDVPVSIATNLAIGLAVSLATFLLRAGYQLPLDFLWLALVISGTSLPDAYLGADLTRRVPARKLS